MGPLDFESETGKDILVKMIEGLQGIGEKFQQYASRRDPFTYTHSFNGIPRDVVVAELDNAVNYFKKHQEDPLLSGYSLQQVQTGRNAIKRGKVQIGDT